MISENPAPKRYFYSPSEGSELRSVRRLKRDLGVNQAAVESILCMRKQVFELQFRLRLLEIQLTVQVGRQQIHLARIREFYDDAIWFELEDLIYGPGGSDES